MPCWHIDWISEQNKPTRTTTSAGYKLTPTNKPYKPPQNILTQTHNVLDTVPTIPAINVPYTPSNDDNTNLGDNQPSTKDSEAPTALPLPPIAPQLHPYTPLNNEPQYTITLPDRHSYILAISLDYDSFQTAMGNYFNCDINNIEGFKYCVNGGSERKLTNTIEYTSYQNRLSSIPNPIVFIWELQPV